jgi:Pao retrotransposon peptidase
LKNIIYILSPYGFQLCKLNSNAKTKISQFPETLVNDETTMATLGMIWNSDNDTWSIKNLRDKNEYTKRTILGTMMLYFDPLAFISPALIKQLNALRNICKKFKHWDKLVDLEIQVVWERIQEELKTI